MEEYRVKQIQPNHADHISCYRDEYLDEMFENESVVAQLKYDGEPSITFTFPAGKLCAYSFDMSEQGTLKAMLKEMERPINNKICMYLRKRDMHDFESYKKQYNALLEEALAEHKSYKEAVKKFAEEHNFS